jgi:hypothetical protein
MLPRPLDTTITQADTAAIRIPPGKTNTLCNCDTTLALTIWPRNQAHKHLSNTPPHLPPCTPACAPHHTTPHPTIPQPTLGQILPHHTTLPHPTTMPSHYLASRRRTDHVESCIELSNHHLSHMLSQAGSPSPAHGALLPPTHPTQTTYKPGAGPHTVRRNVPPTPPRSDPLPYPGLGPKQSWRCAEWRAASTITGPPRSDPFHTLVWAPDRVSVPRGAQCCDHWPTLLRPAFQPWLGLRRVRNGTVTTQGLVAHAQLGESTLPRPRITSIKIQDALQAMHACMHACMHPVPLSRADAAALRMALSAFWSSVVSQDP